MKYSSANHDFCGTEKWRRDFDEHVNRSLKEHRFRRIELIKWSKLPDSDKGKWLEFYNKPSPNINLMDAEIHDLQRNVEDLKKRDMEKAAAIAKIEKEIDKLKAA